jgi:hypothetical protein
MSTHVFNPGVPKMYVLTENGLPNSEEFIAGIMMARSKTRRIAVEPRS